MIRNDPLPTEWNQWRAAWAAWYGEQRALGNLLPTSWRFPGKNFMADEVLGTWSVNGRNVELSAVTFPALGESPRREIRYIGVTFGTGANSDGGDLCATFAELEEVLGIGVRA